MVTLDNDLKWVGTVKDNIDKFVNYMQEDNFSFCKYSYSGDLIKHKRWGLGNLVFMTKIMYITCLIERQKTTELNNIIEGIKRFEHRSTYIFDPLITRNSFKDSIKKIINKLPESRKVFVEQIKRAETRQSYAALYLLGATPAKPFINIPYTKEGIDKYLASLNWERPWNAGSHFSHLLFFLRMNERLFSYKTDESSELIKHAVSWISKIQSKNDGTWFMGNNVSLPERINGAMKILTGLEVAEIYDFPYAEKLLDTALSGTNDTEACSNFNILYVIYCCRKCLDNKYRKNEIDNFVLNRIKLYREFYHPDKAGFSFYKGKANTLYYGKDLTSGQNEPDIHGSTMFIWALSLVNELLDLGYGYRVPLN